MQESSRCEHPRYQCGTGVLVWRMRYASWREAASWWWWWWLWYWRAIIHRVGACGRVGVCRGWVAQHREQQSRSTRATNHQHHQANTTASGPYLLSLSNNDCAIDSRYHHHHHY